MGRGQKLIRVSTSLKKSKMPRIDVRGALGELVDHLDDGYVLLSFPFTEVRTIEAYGRTFKKRRQFMWYFHESDLLW